MNGSSSSDEVQATRALLQVLLQTLARQGVLDREHWNQKLSEVKNNWNQRGNDPAIDAALDRVLDKMIEIGTIPSTEGHPELRVIPGGKDN